MVAIEIAARYSKSSPKRLECMKSACQRVDKENIPGDIVECGVWQGGNIILARLVSPHRRVWLYDTFDGMTAPTQHDYTRGGKFALEKMARKVAAGHKWNAVSVAEVRENMEREGVYDPAMCRFIVGDVCQTLNIFENLPDQIALLRLDTDWYASTRMEMVKLYPRLSSGGILIVDDYNHWQGSKKAVDEYFKKAGFDYTNKLWPIDYTAVWMVKP